MKGFGKGFLSGILVLTLVLSSVGFAAVKTQKIDVLLNAVKLSVDGKYVSSENIVYKDKLYVPADKIAASIGKKLAWDKNKNTASISDPVVASKYNIQNPAPLKTMQQVSVKSAMYNYKAEVSIDEVLRGDAAWQMIKASNKFNQEPPAGKEYLVAKINFKLNEISDGKSLSVSSASFRCFSTDSKKYEAPFVVSPEPAFQTELYAGASHTGWASFLVDAGDLSPKVTFGQNYDGTGGIWFSLK